MDLPTYTSIWRIEKRLYKLYDFRLPMPLPIGQLTVFAAITIPYVMLLTASGLPFNHTLIWLYVLPPAAATWLVTRPVLEGKRLPELIRSQARYVAEPRVWCRMAPLAERDAVLVTGRVWALSPAARPARLHDAARPARPRDAARLYAAAPLAEPTSRPGVDGPLPPDIGNEWPIATAWTAPGAGEESHAEREADQVAPLAPPARQPADPADHPAERAGRRPRITVVGAAADALPPTVDHVLAAPATRRGTVKGGRVSVVPGGSRPGKPDQLHRDRARARLRLHDPGQVVVLGCTVGAGQTVTTLLTGELLASLRDDEVAVLDLNPGSGSLAERAMARPALSQAASLGPSRLVVLGAEPAGDGEPSAAASAHDRFDLARSRYELVLADPSTASIPRLLPLADQLVLVAPASAAAAGAIGMTYEWLEAHGQSALASTAIVVLNGVSRRSLPHVEQAERICVGRCQAIVRVPWDDQLNGRAARPARQATRQAGRRQTAQAAAGQQWTGVLSPATAAAYTALAGVIVAALAAGDRVAR